MKKAPRQADVTATKKSPREIRKAAGVSQIQVAVAAGVSEPTVRLYEANPEAVSSEKRRALDVAYEGLQPCVPARGLQ